MKESVEVHTPDGVELHMPLAGVGSRIMAGLVDVFLLGLLWGLVAIVMFASMSSWDVAGAFGMALFVLFIFASSFLASNASGRQILEEVAHVIFLSRGE